jgi:hypothetical protein
MKLSQVTDIDIGLIVAALVQVDVRPAIFSAMFRGQFTLIIDLLAVSNVLIIEQLRR